MKAGTLETDSLFIYTYELKLCLDVCVWVKDEMVVSNLVTHYWPNFNARITNHQSN